MIKLPTLYKQKSKKMMQWWIEVNTTSDPPFYTVYHGYLDGKIQSTSTSFSQGKNIGRINSTTPAEQCQSEALSLWTKQKDRKGYSENINAEKPIFPMLAHSWDDHKHKMRYPLMIQPKYDGCTSGDSLVQTKEFGYKPIAWIVDNEIPCHIKSFNIHKQRYEYKKAIYYFKDKQTNENIEWYEIELESGEKLKLTGNHLVYLPDLYCWRRVDKLDGSENLMVR